MRRLGQFFGQGKNRKSRAKARQSEPIAATRFSARFEPLEERRLLAANILGSLEAELVAPGDSHELQLTVSGGESALIAFRMHGTSGSLDPDHISVENLAQHTIAPVVSRADVDGGNDSFLLVDLAPGTYSVMTRAEGSTIGGYQLDVFLPGDLSGDGEVDDFEMLWAGAAVVQEMGSVNHFTQMFYQSQGIDLSEDLYRTELDTDMDGDIDNNDLGRLGDNEGVSGISVELIGDMDAPVIQAGLVNDTGSDDTDGITNELAVAGSVQDDRVVTSFLAGFDDTPEAQYVSILADLDATGNFVLDQTRLEEIAGSTLADNGSHTLHLLATDDVGNVTDTPFDVTFTLDTIAPAAPTDLDLATASDLGFFDDDNVTADNTPTLDAQAETGSLVELHSDLDGYLGEGLVNSPVSVTTDPLGDGIHQITATATDVAGNVSVASDPLSVEIETIAPVVPTLDLDAASDTDPVGDQLTSLTSVTLEGVAEEDSRMSLLDTGATATADGTGAFSFAGVNLAFGANSFTVVSMDLAGNTASFTQTISQNDAPTANPFGSIDVDEDPGDQTIDLAASGSELFADLNLGDGDTLTLSVVGNTNPDLVTPVLTGTSGQVIKSNLGLSFGQDRNGTATITIRATDAAGEFVDADVIVDVAAVNDAPVAVNDGEDGDAFTTDEESALPADASRNLLDNDSDPDGDSLAVIPFDGTSAAGAAVTINANGTFSYDPSGLFNYLAVGQTVDDTFAYTVSDGLGGTDTATVTITITGVNDAPVAGDDGDDTFTTDEETTLPADASRNLLDNDSDPDGDALAVTPFDGASAAGAAVTINADGTFSYDPSGLFNHLAVGQTVDDTFSYTVSDGQGGTDTATVTITITGVNDAPVAVDDSGPSYATLEESALPADASRNLLDNDDDPDGDALVAIPFVGTSDVGAAVTINADGTFLYDPSNSAAIDTLAAGEVVPDTFTYTVSDGNGGTDTGTVNVTLTGLNDAPTAVNDDTSVANDTSTELDVLDNDVDPDNGDVLTIESVTQGSHNGTVVISGGKIVYTPVDLLGGEGTETFTYTVRDLAGETDTITVELTVLPNNPPDAVNDAFTTDEETALPVDASRNLLDNDSDLDGDTLTVTPFNGTSDKGAAVTINADGTFSYDPGSLFNGVAADQQDTDTFSYTVSDGHGGTETGTVTITITGINDPVVVTDDAFTTDEDTALPADASRNLLDNDSDLDGDTLTVTPFNGASDKGAAVTINADGTFSYDPGSLFNGLAADEQDTDTFSYTVSDGHGSTDTATVTIAITGVNDPVALTPDAFTTDEDAALPVDASRNLLDNDYDLDGDTLTVTPFNGTSAAGVAVTINADGTFSYDPGSLFNGLAADEQDTDTFSYTVSDGHGSTDTATVTITITGVNDPVVVTDDAFTTNEAAALSVDASRNLLEYDSDPDGDTLTVTPFNGVSAAGAAVTINADGTFSYDPGSLFNYLAVDQAVDDTFTYTVSDGQGGTDTATVTITITGVNDPVALTDDAFTTDEDAALPTDASRNLLDNDSDPDGDTLTVTPFNGTSDKGASVTINADGTFSYDSGSLFNGLAADEQDTDTFSYTVGDGHGGTDTATVTITITGVNDPVALTDDAFTTDEDAALSADASRNLLDNDSDPDGDTLTVTPFNGTSDKGASVTINADGTFSYDPGSLFNGLAADEQDTDTFTYTVSDGQGGTDTATVTITVTGVNDTPDAVNDDFTTDEDNALPADASRNLLGNDSDPDGDTLTVTPFDGTSDKGAAVTINADGTFSYDPGSLFNGLLADEQDTDTFTYTVSDGQGGTDTATVTVTVLGSTDALEVAAPIDDMILADASSPQPDVIDLTTIFSVSAGMTVTYAATSSNEQLVQVAVVNGTELQVTYVTYDTGQDRTPAVITVTATDVAAPTTQASDQFTVTVSPEETVNVHLVVLDTATPTAGATSDTLPTSIGEVAVGSTYVVEIWMQDLYDDTVTDGPSQGLVGAYFDVSFDETIGEVGTLDFMGPYFNTAPFQTGTIDNVNGVIDDFGSGVLTEGLAVEPNYTRLGYFTIDATSAGVQNFTLSDEAVARFASGSLDASQIDLGSVSVNQVAALETVTFDVLSRSTMNVSGTVNGVTLEPSPASAGDAAGLTGSLEVLVDDLDNLTQLGITSGTIDVTTNVPDGPFSPGVGGTTTPADGDFAFTAEMSPGDIVELAIRDLMIDLSTSDLLTVTGSAGGPGYFSADEIDSVASAGFADVRSSSEGSRSDLTDTVATPDGEEAGTVINTGGDAYELTFVYSRTLDLSSIIPNTVITISGTMVAGYDASGAAITGTEVAETSGAESATGVHMTLTQQPTLVDDSGQVSTLPQSEAWVDEWDSYWVEVWVETSEASGVTAASVDLAYDADYFTATQIDHAGTYVDNPSGDLDQDGLVLGLGGSTVQTDVGGTGYALLGRVKFESLDGDQVAFDAENQIIESRDLGLELSNLVSRWPMADRSKPRSAKHPRPKSGPSRTTSMTTAKSISETSPTSPRPTARTSSIPTRRLSGRWISTTRARSTWVTFPSWRPTTA